MSLGKNVWRSFILGEGGGEGLKFITLLRCGEWRQDIKRNARSSAFFLLLNHLELHKKKLKKTDAKKKQFCGQDIKGIFF
jgi:hypothetical protein